MLDHNNPVYGREPILERTTHVFGLIELFPPRGNPAEWHTLPWIITAEKGGEDGRPIKARVKAEYAHAAYERPAFITKSMLYYE